MANSGSDTNILISKDTMDDPRWPLFGLIDLIWTKINPSLTYVLIELSPFKTLLRKFSYGILLTCSLLDIMLCSFTLWANMTEEVTPLSCRLTEKIRNISKKSNLCLPVKNDNPSAPIVKPHVSFKTHLSSIYFENSFENMNEYLRKRCSKNNWISYDLQ